MPQPYSVVFGPWVPDGADFAILSPGQYTPTPVPLADCLNVYWSDQGYRSLPSFVEVGTALPSQALGAVTVLDSSDAPHIYVGTGSDLFTWNGTGFTNVSSSAGAYAGSTSWSLCGFAGCVIAANGLTILQDMTVGGSNFAAIAGSPQGRIVGTVGQFLLVGDITSPTAVPYRLMWSGIGDPTSWPTPLTDAAIAVQSSQEDLTQDFGRIMFIGGGPQMGVIFQQMGITRATYVGGDVVFTFMPYERKRGLVAPKAAVQLSDDIFFLADDGFWLTDGMQMIPIGAATDGSVGLDRWFWNNVNRSALSAIRAAYDASLKCVMWSIPTGTSTQADTLIILNPADRRWTRASLNSEVIWTDTDGTRQRVGIFSR